MYLMCWAVYRYVHLPNEICQVSGFQKMFPEEIGHDLETSSCPGNIVILSASYKQTYFTLCWKRCQELT